MGKFYYIINIFYEKGIRNIVALDFNDLRTREIPLIFRGKNFITIKLISSNYEQNKNQMILRGKNGLIDLDLLEESTRKIMNRELLPNEVLLDIANKSKKEVLEEAIKIIDNFKSKLNFEYSMPNRENFYSWVKSENLRN